VKKIILILSIACSLVISCSSFIPDEDVERLKVYESEKDVYQDYILLEDVKKNEYALEKGAKVRIIIAAGDDSIKVYAYRADEDVLKAHRVLILHLFDTDFPDEIFSLDFFNKELAKVIRRAGAEEDAVKDDKKSKKKTGKKNNK